MSVLRWTVGLGLGLPAVALAQDADGDGVPDELDACPVPGDGLNLFHEVDLLAPAGGFLTTVVLDVDLDGDLDVAAGNGGLQWFENTGGAWVARALPGVDWRSLVVGDFDLDGWPDLAGTQWSLGTVEWFRNRHDGTFDAPRRVWASSGTIEALHADDLDGDGLDDLVFAETGWALSPAVSTVRNLGGGLFDAPVVVMALTDADALGTGDFDGDGDRDLAVAAATVSVLDNQGGGSFGPPTRIGSPFSYGGSIRSSRSSRAGCARAAAWRSATWTGTATSTWSSRPTAAGSVPRSRARRPGSRTSAA